MYNKHIVTPLTATLLSVIVALAAAWARPSSSSFPAQGTGAEKTLTGTLSDSKCKGRIDRKAVTLASCARQCTHFEGADYVLLVGDAVCVLDGHRNELDKFAGGRATITGRVNGNNIALDSVTSVNKHG